MTVVGEVPDSDTTDRRLSTDVPEPGKSIFDRYSGELPFLELIPEKALLIFNHSRRNLFGQGCGRFDPYRVRDKSNKFSSPELFSILDPPCIIPLYNERIFGFHLALMST